MQAGRGVKGLKEVAAWGWQDCWGKTLECTRNFGAVSTK